MSFVKKVIKAIIMLLLVVGLVAGSVIAVKHFLGDGDAPASDIYKEKTKRNKKYNGVYTLTKVDEKGNNTWDGLICYVKDDKIVSGGILDYISDKELKKDAFGDENVNVDENDLTTLILERVTGLELGAIGDGLTGFNTLGSGACGVQGGNTIAKFSYEAYKTKLDINDKKIYNPLYKSGLLGGYDEESQEVWLSKLINNEKSQYHKGYKLIHYKNADDIEKNCFLDTGMCISILNENFNANLD